MENYFFRFCVFDSNPSNKYCMMTEIFPTSIVTLLQFLTYFDNELIRLKYITGGNPISKYFQLLDIIVDIIIIDLFVLLIKNRRQPPKKKLQLYI